MNLARRILQMRRHSTGGTSRGRRRLRFALAALALAGGNVMAGSSAGPLSALGVTDDGVLQFTAGTHINMPRCVKRGGTWAIALSRPDAEAMLALLRTAAVSHAVVRVEGSGLCDDLAGHERPRQVLLEYPPH